MTVKKCTKKRDSCEKLLFLFIDPFAFLTFSLPTPSLDLKVPNICSFRNESTASRSLLFFVFQSEENCSVVSNLKEVINVFCLDAFLI